MNLYILTASLALLWLHFCFCLPIILAITNQSLTYENALLGFEFQYPAQWKHILEKDMEGTGVHFSPLPLSPSEDFADLLIYTSDHHENKTLKQYLHEFILQQLCCIDNKSLKYNESKLSGIPSIDASWNLTKENNQVYGKAFSSFTIKDGIAYVIHYDANLDTFDRWLPEIKKISNSFQIIG